MEQATRIGGFLKSCAGALLQEAREKGLSMCAALDAELININNHLAHMESSELQESVLRMTGVFYQGVRDLGPHSRNDFDDAVDSVIARIEKQVLSVKVIEIA